VETELHRRFAHARVNRINLRREYFYTTPAEVKAALADVAGNLLQFIEHPDAEQYRSSEQVRADESGAAGHREVVTDLAPPLPSRKSPPRSPTSAMCWVTKSTNHSPETVN
jgi:hypothetical protein